MASKSVFESHPVLTLGVIVVLAVAADAFAARGGGGGGGHGGGGAFRSGAPVRSGASTAHPDTAVRSGQVNAPVNAPVNVHHGVAFHRHFVHHRFVHRGFRVYSYDGCYRWRRDATPFGWTLRRVNVYSAYYGQYYD